MGLCTLADVKTWLNITNTTSDAKLQLFIDTVSSQMVTYLGYQAARTTYTNEVHTINNNQFMFLKGAPIQSVTSVTIGGVAVTSGDAETSYQFDDTDAKVGRLYIGTGFCGNYYTRNMAYDPVAGQRSVYVSYIAGWYMPGDIGYVLSDAQSYNCTASLPYTISLACIQEVVQKYRKNISKGEGLISYSEGGVSWGWKKSVDQNALALNGLSEECAAALNAYRRYGIA